MKLGKRVLPCVKTNIPSKIEDERRIVDTIKHISRYIDTVIVGDYELYEYVQSYFKKVAFIRSAIDLRQYNIDSFPSKDNRETSYCARS